MRTVFFDRLLEAALVDPDIVLITGDLGFGCGEPLATQRPRHFINAGVAEQNMTGLAAGIALSGGRVFTYSIANFPTLRCLEQIRNDIAYHNADVTIVAVGGGLAYGQLGMSHHATEDLAIMRAIPGLAVAAPGDPAETACVMADLLRDGGPAYLRLGKAGERTVHSGQPSFQRGESVLIRTGGDVALFSTGAMLETVCEVADLLEQQGIRAAVRSFPWLDPLDVAAISETDSAVVTVEEHSIAGGLGGAVAEVLAERVGSPVLLRIGLPQKFCSIVGDQQYLRSVYGLDAPAIVSRVQKYLEENRGIQG